ncbi:MAG TPA: hypothetical protein VMG58_13295 [Candidatus Sulfotelmatobacter sp.]|nr:hypothetical protein [Candidatus Sulfotelmatobacter sp.]
MTKLAIEDVRDLLGQVQAQLATLSQRLERLEAAAGVRPVEAPAPASREVAGPTRAAITEEEVLAISAALAAYLGVRVHIRQVRLVSSPAWAQQGRVSIQASHRLHN